MGRLYVPYREGLFTHEVTLKVSPSVCYHDCGVNTPKAQGDYS